MPTRTGGAGFTARFWPVTVNGPLKVNTARGCDTVALDVNVNLCHVGAVTVTHNMRRAPEWGIAEFAQMFGVTPRTVRFYEDKGLLKPARDGQARRFGPRQHARFERILRGKRLGFSLDDIRAVFDVMDGRISDPRELRRRRDNFQAVIDGLAERKRDVAQLETDMSEIVGIIDDHLAQNPDDETTDVAQLAARYQAAFAQHLST